MSRGWMLAMMDAMVFTTVIMVAASILLIVSLEDPAENRDVSFLLESLMSVEMRMSDLVDGGDDSHLRASDLSTLYVAEGGDRIGVYLTDVLDSFSGPSPYRLELRLGENIKVLEDGDDLPGTMFESTLPVTTVRILTARLSLYQS